MRRWASGLTETRAHRIEHPQVLRDARLGDAQSPDHVTNGPLLLTEVLEIRPRL